MRRVLDGGDTAACASLLKGCTAEAAAAFNLTGVEVDWSNSAETSGEAGGEASGEASGETRGDVTVQFDLPPGAYATMALREVMRATPAPSPGHVRFGDAEGDGR